MHWLEWLLDGWCSIKDSRSNLYGTGSIKPPTEKNIYLKEKRTQSACFRITRTLKQLTNHVADPHS